MHTFFTAFFLKLFFTLVFFRERTEEYQEEDLSFLSSTQDTENLNEEKIKEIIKKQKEIGGKMIQQLIVSIIFFYFLYKFSTHFLLFDKELCPSFSDTMNIWTIIIPTILFTIFDLFVEQILKSSLNKITKRITNLKEGNIQEEIKDKNFLLFSLVSPLLQIFLFCFLIYCFSSINFAVFTFFMAWNLTEKIIKMLAYITLYFQAKHEFNTIINKKRFTPS